MAERDLTPSAPPVKLPAVSEIPKISQTVFYLEKQPGEKWRPWRRRKR